jgi:hypothetical protein
MSLSTLERRMAVLKRDLLLLQQYMPKPGDDAEEKRLGPEERLIALKFLAAVRKGMAESVWAQLNPDDYQKLIRVAPTRPLPGEPNGRAPERKRKRGKREGSAPSPGVADGADGI